MVWGHFGKPLKPSQAVDCQDRHDLFFSDDWPRNTMANLKVEQVEYEMLIFIICLQF